MNTDTIIENAFFNELEKIAAPKWVTRLGGVIGGARAKSKALKGVEKQVNKEWKLLNKKNPMHGHNYSDWVGNRREEILKGMSGQGGSFVGKHKGAIALGIGALGVYGLAKKQQAKQQTEAANSMYGPQV